MTGYEIKKCLDILDSNTRAKIKSDLLGDIGLYEKLLPLVRKHIDTLNSECKDATTQEYAEYLNQINRLIGVSKQIIKQVDELYVENTSKRTEVNCLSYFGVPHYIGEDFIGTKPVSIKFDTLTKSVNSWSDVLSVVCNILYDKYPANFIDEISKVINFSNNKASLRAGKKLGNTHKYIETGFSPNDTMKKVESILEKYHIPLGKLKIYLN